MMDGSLGLCGDLCTAGNRTHRGQWPGEYLYISAMLFMPVLLKESRRKAFSLDL